MRNQSQSIVEFRLSKHKEIEGIIWTFAHLSELRTRSSCVILPSFSVMLGKRLCALRPTRKDFNSPIIMDGDTRRLLVKEFSKIYNPSTYRRIRRRIQTQWQSVEKKFFSSLGSLPKISLKKSYYCYLTLYGGGGSFGRGQEIYIRVNPIVPSDFKYSNYTIAHELIHLMTESYLTRKKISLARREHFVDQIILKSTILGLL